MKRRIMKRRALIFLAFPCLSAVFAACAGALIARAKSTKVDLRWYAVPGAASYNVYRDAALIASTTGLVHADLGLTNGVTYTYAVDALDSGAAILCTYGPVTATPNPRP